MFSAEDEDGKVVAVVSALRIYVDTIGGDEDKEEKEDGEGGVGGGCKQV